MSQSPARRASRRGLRIPSNTPYCTFKIVAETDQLYVLQSPTKKRRLHTVYKEKKDVIAATANPLL